MQLYLIVLSVLLMVFFVSVSGQRQGWQDNREQGNQSWQGNRGQGDRDQGNRWQGNQGQGNRVLYGNRQGDQGQGNQPQNQGNWGQENSCFCNKSYFPVCGSDGKTYGNQCMAKCANVDVKHRGRCGQQLIPVRT